MVTVTPMYGGAITTVIPEGFIDASMLREVPDTQEVYVNSRKEEEEFSDGLGLNESIVVDLLQMVESPDIESAFKVHVNEIAALNGSKDWKLIKNDHPTSQSVSSIMVETALKWGKADQKETVVSCIGLIRLREFETDVVITVNVPVANSVEAEGSVLQNGNCSPRIQAAYDLLGQMINEFKVIDKSLFV